MSRSQRTYPYALYVWICMCIHIWICMRIYIYGCALYIYTCIFTCMSKGKRTYPYPYTLDTYISISI